MAITPLSSIELYWGADHGKHEYVVLAMSCNQFQDISQNFCITNGKKEEFSRVWQRFPYISKESLTKYLEG
jgi:hypothetical protein